MPIFFRRTIRSGTITASASIVALAAATPAAAQTVAQTAAADEILVVGVRPVAVEDVTASVTVLTAEDLDIRAAPFLADQLRAAPGLAISRSGARGGLTQIRARGAEGNHTLVLIDGIEVSDPVTGETDFGLWAGVDAERVEILRGEQSALYGSDAIGGVIGVRTNRDSGLSAALEGGGVGTIRGAGRAGVGDGETYASLSVSGFATDGVDTSGPAGGGGDGERDGSTAIAAAVNGGVALGSDWTLSGLARYSLNKVETDADTDFDGLLNDTDRRTRSDQWLVGAALEGAAFGLAHAIRASYGRVERDDEADGAFNGRTIGERTKIVYAPGWSGSFGELNVAVNALADYEREDYQRDAIPSFFGDASQEQTFETFGIAGEARATYGRFTVNGSIRRDDNDDLFENAVTWRTGAAFRPTETTKLRASVGEGVKNPTFTELFGFFPESFVGNPNLQPEKSFSFEVGIDQRIGSLDVSATYFNAQLEDEIFTAFNPDFTSSPANRAGDSERQGVEVGARWALTEEFSVAGAYAYVSSEDDAGVQEIRVPEHTGSFALDWRSLSRPGLRAGVAVDVVGAQDDTFFTFPAERVQLDAYALVSATAEVPVTDRLSVTLRGENLADATVTDVFGFAQPGASVFAGIRIR
ncbi:MAG: TonB-dependent receptor [Pseudomonadota bacterium]